MEFSFRNAFLVLVGLMLYASCVVGLQCYQCSSQNDPECMENFDTGNSARYLVSTNCNTFAAKYCVKTTGIYGGIVGTRRFCSSRDLTNMCQYITYPHHDRVYKACVYTCTGDDCNGSSHVTLTTSVLTLSAALYVLLFHFV